MKKWLRILSVMLMSVLILASLTACGKKELDAKAAVDAYLKAETRGEFEEYAKLTGEDKEDLEEEYNSNLEEVSEMFDSLDSLGIDVGDELAEEVKNLMKSTKYEVKDSQQDEDGNYTVDVDVYPSDVITIFFEKIMEGAAGMTDTSELGNVMVQGLKDAIAEQTYGEPETCQVRIAYDKDSKQYEMNEDDIDALVAKFIDTEDVMGMDLSQMYAPSGTVYDNPYLNWTYDDWTAATEDERTQCCLAILQAVNGYTDEEMAAIDASDPTMQEAIQTMKDGINLSYSGGLNISMGDYVEMLKTEMGY